MGQNGLKPYSPNGFSDLQKWANIFLKNPSNLTLPRVSAWPTFFYKTGPKVGQMPKNAIFCYFLPSKNDQKTPQKHHKNDQKMTTFLIKFFILFYKIFQNLPKNYQILPKIVYVRDVHKTVKNHQKTTKKLVNFTNKLQLKLHQKITQNYLKNILNFRSKTYNKNYQILPKRKIKGRQKTPYLTKIFIKISS